MPKISIIVPVYNVKKEYFDKCIKSLTAQSFNNIEIILINDGSTNNSGELCDYYASKDTRIKVFHQCNRGVSVARNKGIDEANGEWITFVDPDDWVDINMCKNLAENIDDKLDILIFTHAEVYSNKTINKYWGEEDIYNLKFEEHSLLQKGILNYSGEFMPIYFGAVWGNLYKKEFIDKNNIKFVEGLTKAQDTIFNLYALEYAKNVKYINKILYYYRHNEESVCYRFNPNIDNALVSLLKQIEIFLIKFNKDIEFTDAYHLKVLVTIMENLKLNYFHKENSLGYREIRKKINELIEREPYKKILRKENYRNAGYKKKLIVFSIQNKLILLLKLMFKCNSIIDNVKNKAYKK